jgi:hypothetical protein
MAIAVWDVKCDHFGRVNFLGMAIIFCNDEGRSFFVMTRGDHFGSAIILGESIFGKWRSRFDEI